MSYIERVLAESINKTPGEKEFHQSLTEVLHSLRLPIERNPQFEKLGLLERLVSPERCIIFRIPWVDDNGQVHVNTGYRIQFNSAIGPYKGGMRFHPSVNIGILKFLAFEQTFKNALTGLPIGGGKGGADFDPKGKSDMEIMRFCQSLITELYKYLGKDTDVPAGDIGVGEREVGFMFGQYKRLCGLYEGVLTGKGLSYGGSLVRKEATGYGLLYILDEALKHAGKSLEGKEVSISGAGNVAIYACEKAQSLGAKVITMSDSNGFIYDSEGIELDAVKQIKLEKRQRIREYLNYRPSAQYSEESIWSIPCQIALPCATQNELDTASAKQLVQNGCYAVAEGANMPCTNEALEVFSANNVLFLPAKAANAGGVATSALEMSQNSMRDHWSFDEVDSRLKKIMINIYETISQAAADYGLPGDFAAGSNIAGFVRVAEAMNAQGIV